MTNQTTPATAALEQQAAQTPNICLATADIRDMKMGDDGSLIITFKDGRTTAIENFGALNDKDFQLTTQDGTVLGAKDVLQNLQQGASPVDITRPAAGQVVEYTLESGKNYAVAFDLKDGTSEITQKDGALIITFDDGGRIVLANFQTAMDAETPPTLNYNGGGFLALEEFLDILELAEVMDGKMKKPDQATVATDEAAQDAADVQPAAGEQSMKKVNDAAGDDMSQAAQDLAGVEPAAGPGGGGAAGGRGGFGFQSSVDSAPLGSPAPIGPIGPTALQFGLPQPEDRLFFTEQTPEEIPPPPTPSLELSDKFVYEDGSVGLGVSALSNGDSNVQMTVIISGIPAAWGVIPNGGVYDVTTGTWTMTLPVGTTTFTGGPTLFPPADSDSDLPNLVVRAENTDVNTGLTSGISGFVDVTTDAVADTPDLSAAGSTVDEDNAAPLSITTAVTDADGSETITTVYIRGVPAGFTLSAGIDNGGGEWVLTQAELTGLTITPPANYFGSINLDVESIAQESNKSDSDFDLTNDQASAFDTLTVTWKPVIDPPSITVNGGVDDAVVKEDGSVDIPVVATLNPVDSPAAFMTVTIAGINPAWGFSAPIGTYDAGTGTWTVTMPPATNLNTILTFTPPAQSDIDLTGLTATVVATEPATGTTASASDGFNIIVDAVADDPAVVANDNSGPEGAVLGVDVTGSLGADIDGSEAITGYQISGVPAGFTFSAGVQIGPNTWAFDPSELAGLTITPPSGTYFGSINLTATVITTENPVSDGETDTSDNDNLATDGFTLTWTPIINPPDITVNGGVDSAQVKEDGSVDVPITAVLGASPGPNEYLTVTVTGINPAWGFSAPVGTYNAGTGTWTVTLAPGASLNTVMTFTPPANSDIDLSSLMATATATDPDAGISANDTDGFNIIVDAVADTPTLDAVNGVGNEDSAPIPVTLNAALTDTDGSELISGYQISGVPAGFSFNQGSDLGGGVWSFTPAQLAGLTMSAPANYYGTINLTATVFTTENPVSDGEFDASDNNAQASDPFTMTWCPVADPPSVTVNNGVDNAIVKEDGSVVVPITATLNPVDSPAAYMTVTVTGINPAWGFSAPIGTYNAGTGTWSITLPAGANLNTAFTFTPPANSDIDLNGLVATATAFEPLTGTNASSSDTFNILVDAVADTPTLAASNAGGDEGTTIPLTISTAVTDTDGSEIIKLIRISDVPAGMTLTVGTQVSPGVWELQPVQLAGLGINVPNGSEGSYTLTIRSIATEDPVSDGEVDFTDNEASAVTTITLNVSDDDQPILIQPEIVTVDETNLGPVIAADSVQANFGADGPGTFSATGGFFAGVTLFSQGQPVVVTQAGNTYTGTANGNTVFTLAVQSDGDYTFTLLGTLDHPDTGNHNDNIALQFGVRATDVDGDYTDGVITVNVLDDGLKANNDYNTFDHSAGVATGNVVTGLNGGPGAADDLSNDVANKVTAVAFGGTTVAVPATGTATIVGAHGTLTIAADGSYTYTAFGTAGGGTHTFTGGPGIFPDMNESQALSVAEQQAIGIAAGDLDVGAGDTVQVTFISEGAGYSNTLGAFSIAADGSIITGSALILNGNAVTAGQNFSFTAAAGVESIGFFLIENGYTANGGYAGLNFNTGTLNMVFDYGLPTERTAKITDNPANVKLVFTDAGNVDHVLNGAVYVSTERGAGPGLNPDGQVHVVSDLANESDNTVLRIGFEDLPNLGDRDYNDMVFDVRITPAPEVDCDTDSFVYTLTDGDGDSSRAALTVACYSDPVTVAVRVNNGVDNVIVKEDGSVFVPVNATVGSGDGDETLTLTLNGVGPGWGFAGAGWTATATPGQYVITLPVGVALYNGGFTLVPPANSDIDLGGLNVVATVSDPDTVGIPLASDAFGVLVDAVADTPTLTAGDNVGNEDSAPVPVTLSAALTDLDGSELISGYRISGVPAGFSFNQGANAGGGVWNFTPAQIVGLNMTAPANYYGTINLTATVFTTENPVSDGEVDFTDNNAQASDGFSMTWCPIADAPSVCVNDAIVKEDSSVIVPITAALNPNDSAAAYLTVTVTGINPAWGFSAPIGTYNAGTGTWSVTLPAGANLNTAFTFTPPANSDVDMTGLVATATAREPVTGTTASASDGFNVVVDAVVDTPSLFVGGIGQQYWYIWGTNSVPLNISSAVTDTDGSEQITKIRIYLNSAFTNNAGGFNTLDDMGVSLNRGTEVAPGVWEIPVNNGNTAAALTGLALMIPAGGEPWMPIHQWNVGGHDVNIKVESYVREVNLGGTEVDYTDNQTMVSSNICFNFRLTPLILDLDGNGINIVNADAGVMFDMNSNGTLDRTSWVGAGDGLLALDINGDGLINDQSELFGNTALFADGFANLASYDLNGDGLINAADEIFARLVVWQDGDLNGVSESTEMVSLAGLGVISISLQAGATGYEVADAWISHESVFTYADGREGLIADVWFNVDEGSTLVAGKEDTMFVGPPVIAPEVDETLYLGPPVPAPGLFESDLLDDVVVDEYGYPVEFAYDPPAELLRGLLGIVPMHETIKADDLNLSELIAQDDILTDAINDFVYATAPAETTAVPVSSAEAVSLEVFASVSVDDVMTKINQAA